MRSRTALLRVEYIGRRRLFDQNNFVVEAVNENYKRKVMMTEYELRRTYHYRGLVLQQRPFFLTVYNLAQAGVMLYN